MRRRAQRCGRLQDLPQGHGEVPQQGQGERMGEERGHGAQEQVRVLQAQVVEGAAFPCTAPRRLGLGHRSWGRRQRRRHRGTPTPVEATAAAAAAEVASTLAR